MNEVNNVDFDIRHLLTPYKLGKPVLTGSGVPGTFDSQAVDCSLPFEHNGRFYMTFVGFDGIGYQTGIAQSDDLINWEKKGVILPRGCNRDWDKVGMACTSILMENDLFGHRTLKKYEGKYWMMYHSYPGEGYESGSAQIGLAWTEDESLMTWNFYDSPVYSWKDGADWEKGGLYKSWMLEHEGRFYMFYNAKEKPSNGWTEQSGMAVSDDMLHWEREPSNPVLRVDRNSWDSRFASDPTVYYDNIKKQWVMFYFGLGNLSACDSLALSDDLRHWEKFPIPVLTTGAGNALDSTYAHKPGLIWHDGCLYHFYCACRPSREGDPASMGGQFRCLSVARSKPW